MMHAYKTTTPTIQTREKHQRNCGTKDHRHKARKCRPLEKTFASFFWTALLSMSYGWIYLAKQDQMLALAALLADDPKGGVVTMGRQQQRQQGMLPDTAKTMPLSRACLGSKSAVDKFCTEQDAECEDHIPERSVFDYATMIKASNSTTTTTATHSTASACKTLWFSGFHEGSNSRCNAQGAGYRRDYARALASRNAFAHDTLQPVLLLGRHGLPPAQDISALRSWATKNGAIVILVPHLSFQADAVQWLADEDTDHQMGPFLSADIPHLVEQHNLFDLQDVCPRHVLYTDSDVMFTNNVTHADLSGLKSMLSPPSSSSGAESPIIMYGRQQVINVKEPKNTGVLLMDVVRFKEELPALLDFGRASFRNGTFPPHTHLQKWFQLYFEQNQELKAKRTMLPLYWNWKASWKLEPHSSFRDLKIVHFHGPKIGKGLYKIAFCETDLTFFWPPEYHSSIAQGICCDQGKTAYRVFELDRELSPSKEEICGDVGQPMRLPRGL